MPKPKVLPFIYLVSVFVTIISVHSLFMVLFILFEHAFTFRSFKSFTTELILSSELHINIVSYYTEWNCNIIMANCLFII